jgi:DNA polymerase-3 subunit alpha
MSNTEAIVKRAKALGQTAIAKTDHGVMYGTKNFVDDANKHGIKPIVGVEAYLSPHSLYDKGKDDKKPFHQLLHAQTLAGYKNLMRLSHIASTDGFYYKPRIDKETLAKYSEGLIATSGCTSSIIPKTLDNPIRLATEMDYWMSVFGKDRFYIELQPNQYHNAINQQLIELAKRYGLHTIVTTDSHYTSPDDYNAHDTMLCIQTNRDKRAKPTEKDLYFSENMYYLMSEDEILRHFDQSHFLGNAILAESVEPLDLSRKHYHIPQYELPSGFESPNDFLRELALSNIENMYPQNVAEARQRLEFELDIIQKTGFADYFLLVWDLCMYTSHVGVLHNVRGSGAGSVTCYLLGITSVDPIENGLLFERFLNPSRVTMPDIDIDYPDSKRQVVIDYLVSRYGVNNVSAIVTFGTMGAKMSIKDVGRAYGMSVADTNAITKQMDSGQKATLDYYYDNVPDFRTRYHNDKHFKTMWDESLQLEGKVRSAGTHPAGIIVTPTPVYNYVALDRATGSSVATRTQEDINSRTSYIRYGTETLWGKFRY